MMYSQYIQIIFVVIHDKRCFPLLLISYIKIRKVC
jgi:hypothetical protein